MDLVDHWVVGFSGKRQLENSEGVRRALRELLQELQLLPCRQNLPDKQLVAISSVAIGADLLFVDETLQARIPWICVLPFPEGAFFNEKDFPDPVERETARQKLTQAADCQTIKPVLSIAGAEESDSRRDAFKQAGFRCVDEADVFIAVVHQTGEPGKPGGTDEVLAYARARNRPLIIIDPNNLETRRENWPPRFVDDLLSRQLRNVANTKLSERERKDLPTASAITAATWRSNWAKAARRYVPGIRRKSSAVVVLHALATIITANVFLLLHPVNTSSLTTGAEGNTLIRVLEYFAFAFVLAGFCTLLWLVRKHPQVKAANYRLAAEVGRSIIATWCIPGVASQIVRTLPHEFRCLGRNLLLYQLSDADRQPRLIDQITAKDIEKLATDYIDRRITPQLRYYSDKYATATRAARRGEIGSIILSFIAVVSAGFLALGHPVEFQRAIWGFAKLVAATAAPVAVSLLVIHEIKRREARYYQMQESLEHYQAGIMQVRSVADLQNLVTDVERMLLGECLEWWVLAKANVAA